MLYNFPIVLHIVLIKSGYADGQKPRDQEILTSDRLTRYQKAKYKTQFTANSGLSIRSVSYIPAYNLQLESSDPRGPNKK